MRETSHRLRAVLDGYAEFLRERDLVVPKQRSYVLRQVREFLLTAQPSRRVFGTANLRFADGGVVRQRGKDESGGHVRHAEREQKKGRGGRDVFVVALVDVNSRPGTMQERRRVA